MSALADTVFWLIEKPILGGLKEGASRTGMTPQQIYGQAMTMHQRGRLVEAESLYRRLLAIQPNAFAPLHMLGVLLAQRGQTDQALEMIGQALRINPRDAAALVNFGNVLNMSRRFE